MSTRKTVVIQVRGRELRLRSDEDPALLEQIAGQVDETMGRIEAQTGTVDTLDVAMLTSLNLARELMETREAASQAGVEEQRLRAVIELAESALASPAS